MEKVLLCIIIIIIHASALCRASLRPKRTFYLVDEPKNWTEAQSYCRGTYTDLATVGNVEEVYTLNQMSRTFLWIGLYKDVDSWRWSDGSNSSFRYWNSGEPNNGLVEKCAAAYMGVGYWESWDCGTRGEFVCYSASECPTIIPELSCMTGTGEKYRGKISVTENNQTCQEWLSQTPHRHSYLPENYPCSGLQLNNCRNPSKHKRPWCYTNDPNTRWDYCGVPVCSGPAPDPKQAVRLKVVSSSSVDLKDPVVLENLLKQLKQKLKDQGVNGDVKLSWRTQSDGHVFHKENKKESRNEL